MVGARRRAAGPAGDSVPNRPDAAGAADVLSRAPRAAGIHQPYGRFWLAFWNGPAIAAGLLPHGHWISGGAGFDPAHLWFLYVLLVFSLALLPLFWYLRGQHGTRLAGRAAAAAAAHPLAMLPVAAGR